MAKGFAALSEVVSTLSDLVHGKGPVVPDSPAYDLMMLAQRVKEDVGLGRLSDAEGKKYIQDRCKTENDRTYALWAYGQDIRESRDEGNSNAAIKKVADRIDGLRKSFKGEEFEWRSSAVRFAAEAGLNTDFIEQELERICPEKVKSWSRG